VSSGLVHSAQSLLAGLVALGRTRLELFSTELQEEIARQAAALVGAFVVLVLGALALAFGAIAVLMGFGEEHRLAASVGISAFFALLAAAAAWTLRNHVRAKPRALEASITALERDYEQLKP
jgi:uncharacterized membrane protein YqjE